jgi:hypothetical protein
MLDYRVVQLKPPFLQARLVLWHWMGRSNVNVYPRDDESLFKNPSRAINRIILLKYNS